MIRSTRALAIKLVTTWPFVAEEMLSENVWMRLMYYDGQPWRAAQLTFRLYERFLDTQPFALKLVRLIHDMVANFLRRWGSFYPENAMQMQR